MSAHFSFPFIKKKHQKFIKPNHKLYIYNVLRYFFNIVYLKIHKNFRIRTYVRLNN